MNTMSRGETIDFVPASDVVDAKYRGFTWGIICTTAVDIGLRLAALYLW
jgi:hypothetical protein